MDPTTYNKHCSSTTQPSKRKRHHHTNSHQHVSKQSRKSYSSRDHNKKAKSSSTSKSSYHNECKRTNTSRYVGKTISSSHSHHQHDSYLSSRKPQKGKVSEATGKRAYTDLKSRTMSSRHEGLALSSFPSQSDEFPDPQPFFDTIPVPKELTQPIRKRTTKYQLSVFYTELCSHHAQVARTMETHAKGCEEADFALRNRINQHEYYAAISSLASYYYCDDRLVGPNHMEFYKPKFLTPHPLFYDLHGDRPIDNESDHINFKHKSEQVFFFINLYGKLFEQFKQLEKDKNELEERDSKSRGEISLLMDIANDKLLKAEYKEADSNKVKKKMKDQKDKIKAIEQEAKEGLEQASVEKAIALQMKRKAEIDMKNAEEKVVKAERIVHNQISNAQKSAKAIIASASKKLTELQFKQCRQTYKKRRKRRKRKLKGKRLEKWLAQREIYEAKKAQRLLDEKKESNV